jgi:hypothetical protein
MQQWRNKKIKLDPWGIWEKICMHINGQKISESLTTYRKLIQMLSIQLFKQGLLYDVQINRFLLRCKLKVVGE